MSIRTASARSQSEWSWRLIFERRDLWIGLYWDKRADGQHFYVCPIPTVVLHGHRRLRSSSSSTAEISSATSAVPSS